MSEFSVGDRVEWTSQAAGSAKTKVGTIVEVIPPGQTPQRVRGIGSSRKATSYVVEVQRAKSIKRYWPLVSALKKTPT